MPHMGHHWNPSVVREARRNLGIRQEDLARAVGVERKTIVAWEQGRTPPLTKAADIAKELDIPLDDLVICHEGEPVMALSGHGKRNPHHPTRRDLSVMRGAAGAAHGG